jgi:hypothetical protein
VPSLKGKIVEILPAASRRPSLEGTTTHFRHWSIVEVRDTALKREQRMHQSKPPTAVSVAIRQRRVDVEQGDFHLRERFLEPLVGLLRVGPPTLRVVDGNGGPVGSTPLRYVRVLAGLDVSN